MMMAHRHHHHHHHHHPSTKATTSARPLSSSFLSTKRRRRERKKNADDYFRRTHSVPGDDDDDDEMKRMSELENIVPDVVETNARSTTLRVVRRFQVDVNVEDDALDEEKSPAVYCKLPANQYNVIDEDKVEMMSDNSFEVSTGAQKFLFLEIEAKGRVKIEETETGVKQTLERTEMIDVSGKNSKIVDAMNKSVGAVRVVNSVMASKSSDGKEHIESQLEFSGTFTEGVFAKIGPRLNEIASFVLGATLPWFLETIGKDYELWSTGGERQKAKMDIGGMSRTILKGAKGKLPSNVREIDVV
tara:strand:+ start:1515 stop:2420 length:906 start_codon:yes stop_codon:yes gene_type:complete